MLSPSSPHAESSSVRGGCVARFTPHARRPACGLGNESMNAPRTIAWLGGIDGHVRLIDQTQLPTEVVYRDCRTVEELWEAIRSLRVRGAPAIGIAAAMGVVLGMQKFVGRERGAYAAKLKEVTNYLRT